MAGGNVQGGYSKSPFHNFDAESFNKKQKEDARLRGVKDFLGEEGASAQSFTSRAPDVVGSEKKKKRHPKEFLGEEELVNEVVDYLLGITVG